MQRKVIVVLLYAVLMTSCGGTLFAFKPFEGNGSFIEGKGGTKTVVDGMEIWDNGEPPRRFSILGYLEVKAQFGADLNFLSRAVKNARQYGGDAIIRQNPGAREGFPKFVVIKFES
jgi:hypothetical protein